MDDRANVLAGYAAAIQQIYKVFSDEFTCALGNTDAERAAEQRFQKGLAHARYLRDRVLNLLQ